MLRGSRMLTMRCQQKRGRIHAGTDCGEPTSPDRNREFGSHASAPSRPMNLRARWSRVAFLSAAVFGATAALGLAPIAWHKYEAYRRSVVEPIAASPDELSAILAVILRNVDFE